MTLSLLPLCGSNAESSDPESGKRPSIEGVAGDIRPESGRNHPEPTTNPHTVHRQKQYAEKRDRVHQAAWHKQYAKTERGRAALVRASKRWNQRHPERIKAHRAVSYAIKRGRLVKGPCELAGRDCKGRIEAHHEDYSRPLDVRWACKAHHRLLDQQRRQGAA